MTVSGQIDQISILIGILFPKPIKIDAARFPGTELTFAGLPFPDRALSREDLPTLERPAKAAWGASDRTSCSTVNAVRINDCAGAPPDTRALRSCDCFTAVESDT
jgi:hypothetical protein